MKSKVFAVLTFTMLIAFPLGLPAEEAEEKVAMRQVEKNIIWYTNRQRRYYGLPPVKLDTSLLRSARRHCWWMCTSGGLQHTTAQVAENIAMGQPSSRAAVRDWMTSSGHRANLLNPRYTRIGTAAFRAADGTIYWCQQFLP